MTDVSAEPCDLDELTLLRRVTEASPSFLHVLRGPDFIFEYANEAYYRLVGRRDLMRRPAFEAMPEAAGEYPQRIAQVMATRHPFHGNEIPVMLARVVELHGGRVMAYSQRRDQGSAFTVRLPCVDLEAVAVMPDEPDQDEPIASKQLKVLVVDDNRDAADTLITFLTMEGHDVRVAYGGQEAIQTFETMAPQVVLLDIGMPKSMATKWRGTSGARRRDRVSNWWP